MLCKAPPTRAPQQAKADSSGLLAPRQRSSDLQGPEGERAGAVPAGPGAAFSLTDVPVHAGPARAPGQGGLPERLKAGVEQLSGFAMDDVRVHRDSPEPARLGALAYTQGRDIYIGRGQDRHLPHEAWHVVQQKQGRVSATRQMKGLPVNEDQDLENEADRMSAGLDAPRFADAAVETMASGKEILAFPDRMSKSTASSGHPIQLQKQEKNPLQPPKDIMLELSIQAFQQNLLKQKLNEDINGEAARALEWAYLSERPYIIQIFQCSTEDVYRAILSLMDVSSTKDGQNAGGWKWTPARKEGRTRRETEVEIIDWAAEEGKGNIKDEVRDKLIKETAVKAAATWRAAQGLEVVAEIVLQGLKVAGRFTLAISILELLNLLMKPVQKSPSRQDQIRADVISWLKGGAESAIDSYRGNAILSRDNVKLGGVEDRVNLGIKRWEDTKAKEAATLRQIRAFESLKRSP